MRKAFHTLFILLAAVGLSACAQGDVATRGPAAEAGLTLATQSGRAAPLSMPAAAVQGPLRIESVQVVVPRSLEVSEANSFYPMADIVWRGDPPGDRHAQIAAIVETAAAQAVAPYQAGRPVILSVEVTKFHGVTEKTRYTIGGKHNIRFDLTLRDAVTGATLVGPRAIVADVKAAGGDAAIAEERAGRTQKVVVTERLVQVLRQILGAPALGAMTVAMR